MNAETEPSILRLEPSLAPQLALQGWIVALVVICIYALVPWSVPSMLIRTLLSGLFVWTNFLSIRRMANIRVEIAGGTLLIVNARKVIQVTNNDTYSLSIVRAFTYQRQRGFAVALTRADGNPLLVDATRRKTHAACEAVLAELSAAHE